MVQQPLFASLKPPTQPDAADKLKSVLRLDDGHLSVEDAKRFSEREREAAAHAADQTLAAVVGQVCASWCD
jgi:predicted kinase